MPPFTVDMLDAILEGMRPPPLGTEPFIPYDGEYDSTYEMADVEVGDGLFADVIYAVDEDVAVSSRGRIGSGGPQTQDIYGSRIVGVLALNNIGAEGEAIDMMPTGDMAEQALAWAESNDPFEQATGYGDWL